MGRGDTNKRICIRVKLEDPQEIMADQLKSKIGFLYYVCCGVVPYGNEQPQNYCACCCICLSSDDIVTAVADKISVGLAEAGILNEVQFDGGGSKEFTIVVRKMNSAKQVVAKGILQKKIREKLRQSNVNAQIEVTRENGKVYKTTEELIDLKMVAIRKKQARQAKANGKEIEKEKENEKEIGKESKEDKKENEMNVNDNVNDNVNEKKKKTKGKKNKKWGKDNKSKEEHLDVNKFKDVDSDEDDWGTDLEDLDTFDVKLNDSNKFTLFASKNGNKPAKSKEKKVKGNIDVGNSYQQLGDTVES